MTTAKRADLVLEGGGVKGIGLVGAISVLEEAGWEFARIAGTSAGAIVASLLAGGMSSDALHATMKGLDFGQFADQSLGNRIPLVGDAIELAFHHGIHSGDHLHSWIQSELANLGVETFGDLAEHDPGSALEGDQKFRLVVCASDISRVRLAHLPWDYHDAYGLVSAEQPVADAVRASASIPFYFRFVKLAAPHRDDSVLVDGGMLSNFPVGIFDRPPGTGPARWPTIGIKLSAKVPPDSVLHRVGGTISMTEAMVGTLTSWYDQQHLDDPAVIDRTIFVDTFGISATDFTLSDADKDKLYQSGREAAAAWLVKHPNGLPTASAADK